MEKDTKSKGKWVSRRLIKKTFILIGVCVLVLLIGMATTFAYNLSNPSSVFFSKNNQSDPVKIAYGQEILSKSELDIYHSRLSRVEGNADKSYLDGKTNILVLGIDESQERKGWGYFRTDTIMVLNIDFENNKANLLSVPRDSLVWIHGYGGKARVNKAFSEGGGYNKNGFEYVMKTVSRMMGDIPIEQYICVDMEVLKDIVDAMGGVDFYVDVEVNTSDAHISIGEKHLWGYQVLAYCRQRKGTSDIARIDRQQKMLKALFNQLKKTRNIVLLPSIFQAVEENLYTNLSFTQICSLSLFATDFELESLKTFTVPGDYLHIGGASLWGIDQKDLEKIIESIYGIDVRLDMSNDISRIEVQVEKYNSAVAKAMGLRGQYASYIYGNKKYLTNKELSKFVNTLNGVEALANTASLTNPEDLAARINASIVNFYGVYANCKALIDQRKASGGSGGGDDSGGDDSGGDDSGEDDSGGDDSGGDDSGEDDSGGDDSGEDDSGEDDSGEDDSGEDDSGEDDSGGDDSGGDDSGGDESPDPTEPPSE